MKKIMSIISMVCVCFSMAFGSAIPVNAEGTGCSTCGIEDTDGSIQKTLEEVLDYTDEEKELVMDSVKIVLIMKITLILSKIAIG